ncbi:MAG: glycosyltransferase [Candidatus Hodarchaeota archaeon]
MRVLQVIPAYPPSIGYGGAPIVAHKISKILAARGHRVIVYTTDANDRNNRINLRTKLMDGIEVHYFRNISNLLAYNYKIFISPKMISDMKKGEFDIIHAHDFRTLQNILVYYFAKKFNIPYLIQPHGKPPLNKDERAKYLKYVFDIVVGNKILKNSSKIFVLNQREAEQYKSIVHKKNIEIIPNGIDISNYDILPPKGTLKDKYKISSDHKIILYLGRIHISKGLDVLIKSFKRLLKKIDKVKLIIAGSDDGYLGHLKQISISLNIEDKIIFTGFLSHRDKISAYVDADVFVTPTFYGFPLTFLESMVCATPIITSNAGDYIKEIDKVGIVVPYDEKELENALFKVLNNESLKERLGINAKKIVKEYDWEKIVDKIEKSYYEAMEK